VAGPGHAKGGREAQLPYPLLRAQVAAYCAQLGSAPYKSGKRLLSAPSNAEVIREMAIKSTQPLS
jgi:hypothetical protein